MRKQALGVIPTPQNKQPPPIYPTQEGGNNLDNPTLVMLVPQNLQCILWVFYVVTVD
jgi:hypothetical protein